MASLNKMEKQKCFFHPSCLCLLTTLGVTALATGLLSASMFTDFWEIVSYNKSRVQEIVTLHNGSHRLTWLFNGTVARIALSPSSSMIQAFPVNRLDVIYDKRSSTVSPLTSAISEFHYTAYSAQSYLFNHDETTKQHQVQRQRRDGQLSNHSISKSISHEKFPKKWSTKKRMSGTSRKTTSHHYNKVNHHGLTVSPPENRLRILREIKPQQTMTIGKTIHQYGKMSEYEKIPQEIPTVRRQKRDTVPIYLIPFHGGIWHLCINLLDDEIRILREMGMNRNICTYYLVTNNSNEDMITSRHDLHVQSKMHNLSISCAMVCLILLGSAALLGLFGIFQRQISAVLITGVMYILAAVFAVFTLTIMHFKRTPRKDCAIFEDHVTPEYHHARMFATGWSMHLGWGGSALTFLASLLWIFLAKVMRYNPLTFW